MPRKRDVGMAGSSDYATEYYTTDKNGNPVRNERTMRLQGLDPKKRIADSKVQEARMRLMMDSNVLPSKRDRARALAVGAHMNERRGTYSEGDFQDAVGMGDFKRREKSMDRGQRQKAIINQQSRQYNVRQLIGKNDFAPSVNAKTTPTLSKMVQSGNKKK